MARLTLQLVHVATINRNARAGAFISQPCCGSLIRNTSFRSRLHGLDVLVQRASGRFVSRRCPVGSAGGELFVGEVDVDASFVGIDGDLVAGFDESDRAAFLSFGRDVADDKAV